jgi:probable rRNA maturation factor
VPSRGEMVQIEIDNRSGEVVDEEAAAALVRSLLGGEGVDSGEVGLSFVSPEEIRALKREHLAIDEVTDVLSFPIDGLGELPEGLPRQLGDVVLCPQVAGGEWRGPLVHGLLHLLGYEHGAEMEEREGRYVTS